MVAMISAQHRLAGAPEVSLRELKDEPWSAPSRDGIVVNACRAAGFEPRLVLLVRDPLASRAFAAAREANCDTEVVVRRREDRRGQSASAETSAETEPLRGELRGRSQCLPLMRERVWGWRLRIWRTPTASGGRSVPSRSACSW
jgi:hypothetical protein